MKKPVRIIERRTNLNDSYLIRFEIGLILSLLLAITITRVEFRAPENDPLYTLNTQEEVMVEEIIQTKQSTHVPPPPRPMVPIEVPDYEVIEEEILDIDAELDLDLPLEIPPPPPAAPSEEEAEEEEIFVVVEQPPVLIGGMEQLQKAIRYPLNALRANVEGKVVVQFVVNKEGKVEDPVVVRGIGAGCDEEAIRVIKQARFTPGKQRGIPVSVRFAIPVHFKIRETI